MQHVFISYVRRNSKVVDRLDQELTSRGIEVWLDRRDLGAGIRWEQAIRRAINEGAFFIACFSKEYHEHDEPYMNEELTIAIERLRRFHNDRVWFIPVKLNECEIPDFNIGAGETLEALTYVKLYEDWNDGIQRILNVIQPKSPEETERKAKLYYQIVGERLKVIETLQAYVKQDAREVIIHRHLYENLWLLDPFWSKTTETPLVEQIVTEEFAGIDANLTEAERRGRFDIKYKKTSGMHIIIELKRASGEYNDYQLLAQTDRYRTALEKLVQAAGEHESVEVVCIVGKPLKQWTTPREQAASKKMLAEKNTRVVLYDELIENAYRMYQDFLDVNEK